jgi:hypothetical protein
MLGQERLPIGSAHRFEEWRGISLFATPSVLYALFAYERTPTDPEEVLRVAVAVAATWIPSSPWPVRWSAQPSASTA